MIILVLGASGMLGNAMVQYLVRDTTREIYGTIRTSKAVQYFPSDLQKNIISGIDVSNTQDMAELFTRVKPEVVINCIGLVKQLEEANIPVQTIMINALLPHQLAQLCAEHGSRLVHFSTDCVFSGEKGNYTEDDSPDAQDLYGRSKVLGEVDYAHAVTLRTSIIGHEFNSAHGLIEWFLSQKESVKGYSRAIFSGLPTCEMARVVNEFVLPTNDLAGVYHVAAEPISKFELLTLVNSIYKKGLLIEPDDQLVINRSLDGSCFRKMTGYVAPPWPELVKRMHDSYTG